MADDGHTIDVGYVHSLAEVDVCRPDCPHPDHRNQTTALPPAECGEQYGSNPDSCYRPAGHDGTHSNRYGTTWASAEQWRTRVLPPAEKGDADA